jgi:polysaccharide export outer membrane protein
MINNKRVKKEIKLVLLFVLLIFIHSCGPKKDMIYMDKDINYGAEVTQAKFQGSKLIIGDVLDIKVTGYDEIAIKPFNLNTISQINNSGVGSSSSSNDLFYTVDKDGEINFPTLGKIKVIGLTLDELKIDLEDRLKKYLLEPIVVVKQNNLKITFLGEFNNRGTVAYTNEKLNILQAIALGGGNNESADLKNIRLIRNVNGVDQTITLDVTDFNISNSPYYYIQNNDILYAVPSKNAQILANKNPYWIKGLAAFGFFITIYTLFFRK